MVRIGNVKQNLLLSAAFGIVVVPSCADDHNADPSPSSLESTGPGPTTAASATTTSTDSSTTESSSNSAPSPETSSTVETSYSPEEGESTLVDFPPPPDAGAINFECVLVGDANACELGDYCIPWDSAGTGVWSGATCVELPSTVRSIGDSCSIPEGPLNGQQDCAPGLVCAASADAVEGVCIPLCKSALEPCLTGECTACNDGELQGYGVCLDAWSCEGAACPVSGCLPE